MNILNEQQRRAVLYDKGHLLVIAGPGTGKTFTLTHKIAYIVHNTEASRILAMTFTNKAAEEMRERVLKLLGEECNFPFIGTFHALCLKILRAHADVLGFSRDFIIYKERESLALLQDISQNFGFSKKDVREIARRISLAKNQCVPVSYLQKQKFIDSRSGRCLVWNDIAQLYQQRLRDRHALDFDDLLVLTLKLFQEYSDVLEKYRMQLRYIFIDEYQDINEVQYRLIRALASAGAKICAIGDPDQAIYAFRGSNVSHFLRFPEDFPETETIHLEQNYRSCKNILNVADHLISHNTQRIHKSLRTERPADSLITMASFENPWKEAGFIVKEISSMMGGLDMNASHWHGRARPDFKAQDNASDRHFSDFAILYRTRAQGRFLESSFKKAGIPYQLVHGTPWYKKKEIRILLAYLQVVLKPDDDMYLFEILNVPARGIGEEAIDLIKKRATAEKVPIFTILKDHIYLISGISSSAKEGASMFAQKILELRERLSEMKPTSFVKEVLQVFALDAFFHKNSDGANFPDQIDRSVEVRGRIFSAENILLFLSTSAHFDSENGRKGLSNLVEHYSILQDYDDYDEHLQAVSLMTLHASKGLEFPVVFIAGIEDGLIPSRKEDSDLEEERRLFYVGITRAREKLYLLHTEQRDDSTKSPSPFLQEFPEKLFEKHSNIERKKKTGKRQNQLRLL